MEQTLSPKDVAELKKNKLLQDDEIALKVGNMIIAENITSKKRRVIETKNLMLECNKKILKG